MDAWHADQVANCQLSDNVLCGLLALTKAQSVYTVPCMCGLHGASISVWDDRGILAGIKNVRNIGGLSRFKKWLFNGRTLTANSNNCCLCRHFVGQVWERLVKVCHWRTEFWDNFLRKILPDWTLLRHLKFVLAKVYCNLGIAVVNWRRPEQSIPSWILKTQSETFNAKVNSWTLLLWIIYSCSL